MAPVLHDHARNAGHVRAIGGGEDGASGERLGGDGGVHVLDALSTLLRVSGLAVGNGPTSDRHPMC